MTLIVVAFFVFTLAIYVFIFVINHRKIQSVDLMRGW